MKHLPPEFANTAVRLMNMTTENGCTEDEAAVAAEKLVRLAERNGVTLEDIADLNVDDNAIVMRQAQIRSRGKTGRPGAFLFATSIADGFECKMLKSTTPGIRFKYVFFCGFVADVTCAAYAYETLLPRLIKQAKDLKMGNSITSFLFGAGLSISYRLITARKAMRQDPGNSSGTALILHDRKQLMIEGFLQKQNIRKRSGKGLAIREKAFRAGHRIGDTIPIQNGLEGTVEAERAQAVG